MALIGSQNPWLVGGAGLDAGANNIVQTLMRLPQIQQQLAIGRQQLQTMQQQDPLQTQILGAQAAQAPAYQAARTGEMASRGKSYDALTKYRQEQTSGLQNKEAAAVQDRMAVTDLSKTTADMLPFLQTGKMPPDELQQKYIGNLTKILGNNPKLAMDLPKLLAQTMGNSNPQLMNDPRMQAEAVLGGKDSKGTTVGTGQINTPIGGGPPIVGAMRTSPGQDIQLPTGVGQQKGGEVKSPYGPPSGSKSSAAVNQMLSAWLRGDGAGASPDEIIAMRKKFEAGVGQSPQNQGGAGVDAGVSQKSSSAAPATGGVQPAPPLGARVVGQVYQTPGGVFRWVMRNGAAGWEQIPGLRNQ